MADNDNQQGAGQQGNTSPSAPSQGSKFDVTPSSPLGPSAQPPSSTTSSSAPSSPPPGIGTRGLSFRPDLNGEKLRLIGAGILVIIVLAAIVFFVVPALTSNKNTTTASTSVAVIKASYLSECGVVSVPGAYYLSGDIKTANTNGACINITTSNVAIICNGHSIIGSGPFIGLPPFSYGVQASGVNNVTVTGCTVGNFSYGVYTNDVNVFEISGDNISTNYQSDIYLSASNNGTVQNNVIMNSSSSGGAVVITNGSTNNLINNNTLKTNAINGFNINSNGNRFTNNNITGSSFSFSCGAQNGFANSNQGSGNSCFNNMGCGFLSCTGVNIPDNVSKINLGPQISSCGSINSPGTYQLSSNVNLRNFIIASNSSLAQISASCIRVNASNVTLNCGGFSVLNSYIGISAQNVQNVQLNNCNVMNSVIGILLNNVSASSVNQAMLSYNNVSLQLQNSVGDRISNVTTINSTYGISLLSSGANIYGNFNASNNRYGIYVSNSLGNIFNGGKAMNNVKFDVFATLDSINSSANIMGSTSCGLTDANWAPCLQHISPSLSFLPISTCATITKPGNYSLIQSIFGSGNNCINIQSDNVKFGCQNTNINAAGSINGPAIYANGRKNITIDNCGIANYKTGIVLTNTTGATIENIVGTNLGGYGIIFAYDNKSTLMNNWIAGPSNVSIYIRNVHNSTIENNNASYGNNESIAYLIQNSSYNNIINNTGIKNFIGMSFIGSSQNNLVTNNSFIFSQNNDFICSPQNNPLNAERGGINYGPFSTGCWWLASIPKSGQSLECAASIGGGSFYSLASDSVYGLGAVCFTVLDNHTIINCAGHTVLATAGGTFARFVNSQRATIENCFLKGFTTPIVAINSSVIVLNNTIFQNLSTASFNPVVSIINSSAPLIQGNNFLTPYTGIYLMNDTDVNMKNNNISAGQTAYQMNKVFTSVFNNNTAQPNSGIGALFANSTLDVFQTNYFMGITSGLVCQGTATGKFNNTDSGQNHCSSNSQCGWIAQSSLTC